MSRTSDTSVKEKGETHYVPICCPRMDLKFADQRHREHKQCFAACQSTGSSRMVSASSITPRAEAGVYEKSMVRLRDCSTTSFLGPPNCSNFRARSAIPM